MKMILLEKGKPLVVKKGSEDYEFLSSLVNNGFVMNEETYLRELKEDKTYLLKRLTEIKKEIAKIEKRKI